MQGPLSCTSCCQDAPPVAAFLVLRRPGGLLLAVPPEPGVVAAADQAAVDEYSGVVGPSVEVAVGIHPLEGFDADCTTACLLLDVTAGAGRFLFRSPPRRRGGADLGAPFRFEPDPAPDGWGEAPDPVRADVRPAGAPVLVEARQWLTDEVPRGAEEYLTAGEEAVGEVEVERVAAGAPATAGLPGDAVAALRDAVVGALDGRFQALEGRLARAEAGIRTPPLAAPPVGPPAARKAAPAVGTAMPPQLAGRVGFAPPGLGAGGLDALLPPPPAVRGRGVAGRPTAAEAEAAVDLDDADAEPPDGDEGGAAPAEAQALMKFLAAQTRAIERLAGGAAAGVGDDLAPLLGGPSDISTTAVGGARGTAALEAQRRAFESNPGSAIRATRQLLAKANGTDPAQRQDAMAYFERHGCFPRGTATHDWAYVAFLLGAVWNRLELGEVEAAQALVGRGLAAVDQTARGSRPSLGFLWTHQAEPPWGVVERPVRSEQQPYSQLAPPGLVAASVAYLKDMDAMEERLAPRKSAPPKPTPEPRPKDKPTGGDGKNGGGKGRKAQTEG